MKIFIFIFINFLYFSNCFSQTIWQQSNGPYTGTMISQLTVNQSGDLFAVSYGGGIFRSTDNGTNWLQVNQGLPQVNFEGARTMCIAPNGDIYSSADNLGIYKSTNNGNTWIQTGLTTGIYTKIAVHSNGYIFIGTQTGGGLYRSTNGGISWVHLENGLPSSWVVNSITITPNGTIYACTSGSTSMYYSTNYGDSWQPSNLPGMSVSCSAANSYGYIFIAGGFGVYRSTNGGNNWEQINYGLILNRFNSIFCSSSNEIFISSDSGLFRSSNNGDNWIRIDNRKYIYSFVKNQTGEYFLSVSREGIYKSTNTGTTWNAVNNGLCSSLITCLSVSQNNNVYCGTMYNGVFRSTNNGMAWSKIWDGRSSEYISLVFQAPNGNIYAGIDSGLYRSTNNGVNWSRVSYLQNINSYYINSNGHIFLGAAGIMYSGIFRSTDNGNSFSMVWFNNYVYSLTGNSSGTIFAGTSGGIYRSNDNGNNWVNIFNVYDQVYSILIVPYGYMYAGTHNSGLFRSTDYGYSWVCIWSGFEDNHSLVQNQNGDIFAFVTYHGIYRSLNYGYNWHQYSAGIFNPMLLSLAINSNGYLYAGTIGAGVYKTINSTIGIKPISNEIPESFSLSQNYPNPFNPQTKIKFGLPEQSFVKLVLFDVLGRKIGVLVNEELKAGEYEVTWDATTLSSGIYFYRLETNKYNETRKMVLVK